ncbi:cytochrome-c peroxidase [Noviherbaspirillum sp. ST9]|uniref:cytochrome-c peroxidase n=1 Tax=Noviherbaspirillum sp. ST9 TaxID=3401606 RepID=UPI003B589B10
MDEPIRPLPEKADTDPARVALGKRLFFDTRFSRDNKVSCASCHDFAKGGADGRVRSPGVDGRTGPANSPTVLNARFNFRQLWNGKAHSLEDQVDMAIANPNVFDSSWDHVLGKLGKDASLVTDFKNAYREGLNRRNVVDALVTFERSLVTPSRFDAYLRGKADAISPEEKLGYARFKSYGCVACHQGVNVGGNMFQVFGAVRPYLGQDGALQEYDLGRFHVTGRESDKFVFKVPSLRNVALTAPYFHNGSARTLEDAVDVMIKYQLGRTAPQEDKALIVKFLHTLTGTLPAHAQPGPAQ